jgi:uncharacterized protein YcbK (DUF882 family)
MLTRRAALIAGFGLASVAALPKLAHATAAQQRALRFHNLHTGETLDAEYWQNDGYAPDALAAINHVLRDHRTDEVCAIDVRLLDLLHELAGQVGAREPFQVISGYRSPRSNAALADASSGVARRSLHMDGKAIDIALASISVETIRGAALQLGRGGVGYYPNPGFVHVDVGRVRQW